jgi:hypothetical protein
MSKLPVIIFTDKDVHNVSLVWQPGYRRRNYTGPLKNFLDKELYNRYPNYTGLIVPFAVQLGFRGIGREIARKLIEARGLTEKTEIPPTPQHRVP